jgi:DNA-directed RNA polymerase specialized sigma24 family protein
MDANPAKRIPSDGELLSAFQRGNEEAAEKLRLRHDSAILAVIVAILAKGCDLRHEHAKEVKDEVWMIIFSKINQLRDLSKFDAWRDQIARNGARAHLRKCITNQNTLIDLKGRASLPDGEIADPSKVVESAQSVDQIMGLAENISPKFAQLLNLRGLEGLSWDEIATQRGENSGTLRKFYQRELIRLKILIKKRSGGRGA